MGSREFSSRVENLVQVLKPKQVRSVGNESGTDASVGIRARNPTHGWNHKFGNEQHMDGV